MDSSPRILARALTTLSLGQHTLCPVFFYCEESTNVGSERVVHNLWDRDSCVSLNHFNLLVAVLTAALSGCLTVEIATPYLTLKY